MVIEVDLEVQVLEVIPQPQVQKEWVALVMLEAILHQKEILVVAVVVTKAQAVEAVALYRLDLVELPEQVHQI
jgi:hypothetical protein